MTTVISVVGLQSFGESLDHRKACRDLAELRRVRFNHRKANRRLAVVR